MKNWKYMYGMWWAIVVILACIAATNGIGKAFAISYDWNASFTAFPSIYLNSWTEIPPYNGGFHTWPFYYSWSDTLFIAKSNLVVRLSYTWMTSSWYLWTIWQWPCDGYNNGWWTSLYFEYPDKIWVYIDRCDVWNTAPTRVYTWWLFTLRTPFDSSWLNPLEYVITFTVVTNWGTDIPWVSDWVYVKSYIWTAYNNFEGKQVWAVYDFTDLNSWMWLKITWDLCSFCTYVPKVYRELYNNSYISYAPANTDFSWQLWVLEFLHWLPPWENITYWLYDFLWSSWTSISLTWTDIWTWEIDFYKDCTSFLDIWCYVVWTVNKFAYWIWSLFIDLSFQGATDTCFSWSTSSWTYMQKLANLIAVVNPIPPWSWSVICTMFVWTDLWKMESVWWTWQVIYHRYIPEENIFAMAVPWLVPILEQSTIVFAWQTIIDIMIIVMLVAAIIYQKK